MNIGDFGRILAESENDIHLDCRGLFRQHAESLMWMVVELVSINDGFATFDCGRFLIKAKPNVFHLLPSTPKHRVGERVQLRNSKGTATISSLQWHRVNREFVYFLNQNGRESSKWYFERDFI